MSGAGCCACTPTCCRRCRRPYDGELQNFDLRWNDTASIAAAMAVCGYPEAPERGSDIGGTRLLAEGPVFIY